MYVPKTAINSAICLKRTKLNDQASRVSPKPTARHTHTHKSMPPIQKHATSAFVSNFLCQEHLELPQGKGHLQVTATPLVPAALKRLNCSCTNSTAALNKLCESLQAQGQLLPKLYWDVCVCVPLLMLSTLHPFLLRLKNNKRPPSSPKSCPRKTCDYKGFVWTSQK